MRVSEAKARATLRDEILTVGAEDYVSLAAVQGLIDESKLADSVAERQHLIVQTVRSMLGEGLIEVGGIPARTNSGFDSWPGNIEEVMATFVDRFVQHYDDRYAWAFKIWLNLTQEGLRASAALDGDRSASGDVT